MADGAAGNQPVVRLGDDSTGAGVPELTVDDAEARAIVFRVAGLRAGRHGQRLV